MANRFISLPFVLRFLEVRLRPGQRGQTLLRGCAPALQRRRSPAAAAATCRRRLRPAAHFYCLRCPHLQMITSIIAFAVLVDYRGWSKANYIVSAMRSRSMPPPAGRRRGTRGAGRLLPPTRTPHLAYAPPLPLPSSPRCLLVSPDLCWLWSLWSAMPWCACLPPAGCWV